MKKHKTTLIQLNFPRSRREYQHKLLNVRIPGNWSAVNGSAVHLWSGVASPSWRNDVFWCNWIDGYHFRCDRLWGGVQNWTSDPLSVLVVSVGVRAVGFHNNIGWVLVVGTRLVGPDVSPESVLVGNVIYNSGMSFVIC